MLPVLEKLQISTGKPFKCPEKEYSKDTKTVTELLEHIVIGMQKKRKMSAKCRLLYSEDSCKEMIGSNKCDMSNHIKRQYPPMLHCEYPGYSYKPTTAGDVISHIPREYKKTEKKMLTCLIVNIKRQTLGV